MSKIGFIGAGVMGNPMAGHLQAGGHQLYLVKHRSPLPQALLDGGAVSCAT
ncbi:MAG: NAD(P)-binding domain-containing protein, partial [Candidatus Thiodiazotropha sp. (ex Lucinoma borealis)]|nr:NAD(P)-binding domain-containing protein [Candidatus Thiodiazotropha sp. (ex Lucinoma borealis)]